MNKVKAALELRKALQLFLSTIDANVWAPDAYPAGWEAL